MNKRELLDELRKLHDELLQLDDVDPPTLEALGQLIGSMNHLMDQSEEPGASTADVAGLRQGIYEQVERFETNHPMVTRFVAQLTDLLGMMGI
jgi:hypothetical protein